MKKQTTAKAIEPKNEVKSGNQVAAEVLTTIRQLEPEDQNEVVKSVLKELAVDRQNQMRAMNDARDRAAKNFETFMYNALGLEKLLAEVKESMLR